MLVMYAGQIVESGTVEQVLLAPKHPYTQGLLDSLPQIGVERRRLASIPGQPPDLAHLRSGCPFFPGVQSGCPISVRPASRRQQNRFLDKQHDAFCTEGRLPENSTDFRPASA